MGTSLQRLQVAGFRSLRNVELSLGPVTVLIGPNGAGKSNVLWALEMVRMLAFESLQVFVGERGGASYLMHYGPQTTPAIDLFLEFRTTNGHNAYAARLGWGANESLIFLSEKAGFRATPDAAWRWSELGAGHGESKLREAAARDVTAKTVRFLLRRVNFYHFHDTSRRSPLRTRDFSDTSGDYLRSDGSNLATFLEGLRRSDAAADHAAWRRIEGTLQRVAPFIKELTPTRDRHGASLSWIDERGAEFGPAHLSDGTLRALALISALAQPEGQLPALSCIDEPELGLHPAALHVLCGLISSVATRHQVLVSTQSPAVLDHFEPADIVVADRSNGETTLSRIPEPELSEWLEEYSLSEIYEKNLIGGRP
jgi:predicted ATPase